MFSSFESRGNNMNDKRNFRLSLSARPLRLDRGFLKITTCATARRKSRVLFKTCECYTETLMD